MNHSETMDELYRIKQELAAKYENFKAYFEALLKRQREAGLGMA